MLSEDVGGEGEATYIWGTNLSVSRIQSRFNVFVREFKEEGEEEPKYLRLLQEVRAGGRAGGQAGGQAGGRERAPEFSVCVCVVVDAPRCALPCPALSTQA